MTRGIRRIVLDYLRTWLLLGLRLCWGRSRLLSLERVLCTRRIVSRLFPVEDALAPLAFVFQSHGYRGQVSELRALFTPDVMMGTWGIDQKGAEKLWLWLEVTRPKTIFEFGSGTSTLLLAAWLKRAGTHDGLCLSIEQDMKEAQRTERRLQDLGLAAYAKVHVAAVNDSGGYALSIDRLKEILEERKVDCVFIDGPAGGPGCRVHTLTSLVGSLAETGAWALHDAFRDGELEVIQQWVADDSFSIDGIYAVGQGLAVGSWKRKEG